MQAEQANQANPLKLLIRDLKDAKIILSSTEARFLVDFYYLWQEERKRADNQIRSMDEEPHIVLAWLSENTAQLEKNVAKALAAYSQSSKVGQWAESIVGIGPILSAGLLAHIDIAKAPTAGHIWNFAGLNPGVTWEKGQKRPWNASLKTICWRIGQSFVYTSNNPRSFYGPLYQQRKQFEEARNEKGELAEQAALALERKNFKHETAAYQHYSQGLLPDAHVHARATRWVVKLFLSHWQQVAYEVAYGKRPALPYAFSHLGHAHILEPPNWPM